MHMPVGASAADGVPLGGQGDAGYAPPAGGNAAAASGAPAATEGAPPGAHVVGACGGSAGVAIAGALGEQTPVLGNATRYSAPSAVGRDDEATRATMSRKSERSGAPPHKVNKKLKSGEAAGKSGADKSFAQASLDVMSRMADTLNVALPSMRTGQQEMIEAIKGAGDDGQTVMMQEMLRAQREEMATVKARLGTQEERGIKLEETTDGLKKAAEEQAAKSDQMLALLLALQPRQNPQPPQ